MVRDPERDIITLTTQVRLKYYKFFTFSFKRLSFKTREVFISDELIKKTFELIIPPSNQ